MPKKPSKNTEITRGYRYRLTWTLQFARISANGTRRRSSRAVSSAFPCMQLPCSLFCPHTVLLARSRGTSNTLRLSSIFSGSMQEDWSSRCASIYKKSSIIEMKSLLPSLHLTMYAGPTLSTWVYVGLWSVSWLRRKSSISLSSTSLLLTQEPYMWTEAPLITGRRPNRVSCNGSTISKKDLKCSKFHWLSIPKALAQTEGLL